ncbi:MAG: ABC transporter ATP-binding protein [Acidimicrobiia bacterium]|nr:ABC transporter ATP-binding protein [Acidimicrobiia bacterium]
MLEPDVAPTAEVGAAITVEGVDKRFAVRGWRPGRPKEVIHALRGVDLEVPAGTVHGVIGPNGSGKSTLLRVLATLVLADTGRATVAGHDVVDDPMAVRRSIGLSTGEERGVYWRLTARQNLEFAAALHRLPDAAERVPTALAEAGLADVADRPVSGFSQGMARRLGLARAMLHRPPVLLLDEPTRSLDPVAREDFHAAALGVRDRLGVTVLITTHDLAEAASICDEVSILHAGRVVGRTATDDADELDAELRRIVA